MKAIRPSLIFLFLITLISGFFQAKKCFSQADIGPESGDTANYPYWIDMMHDQRVNFFTVQKAFNKYWEKREITKGCGWKPFKRWEYMMAREVSASGERPDPARDYMEYMKYKSTHNTDNQNGSWVEIGPTKMPVNGVGLGRLNAIAFHPTDSNILWVGAPSGGLWKTTNGGLSWTSNTDGLPTLGVSAILVDPTNPDILYIGTGDRDAGDAPGLGVMKSTDGGQSWQMSNNGMGNITVGKMLMHPADPTLLYAGTSNGIFRSTDAGASWVTISPNNNAFWKDLAFMPGNPDQIYATYGGQFYRSTNAGASWTHITSGLPGGSRGIIAVTPANPNVVYFALCNSSSAFRGCYKSVDQGISFSEMSTTPNLIAGDCNGTSGTQGWYDFTIAVDPLNENTVFIGGVNVYRSLNSGQNWTIVGHWTGDCDADYVHADQHAFEYNPHNGRLYVGNDGGFYHTTDGGTQWTDLSKGLAVAQIYRIGQSATQSGIIMNGYQDNGSSCYADSIFRRVMGGDGMECAVDYSNHLYKYGEIYYGRIARIYNFNEQGAIAGNGVNGINEEGAWVTPFLLHATNPNTMFVGYKNVWRSNNIKNLGVGSVTWTKISSLGGSNGVAMDQSPCDPDVLYIIKEGHKLYRTDNANAPSPYWTNLSNTLPGTGTPLDIECHPTHANTVYTVSDQHVYQSNNKGQSWFDISGSLPAVSINTIEYCKGSLDGLYVGTNVGVFYRDATMGDWISFSAGLPANGRVMEIELYYDTLNPENSRVRAATYGRGLWESSLFQAPPQAHFTSNITSSLLNCGIHFTDLSSGFPTHWSWSFPGGTPSGSNQKNPQNIQYASPGIYDVQLIVSNSEGADTLLVPGYVTISNTLLPVAGFTASDSILCSGNDVIDFHDTSLFCASAWEWSFQPGTVSFVNGTDAHSQNPSVQFNQDGHYSVTLSVTNLNGTSSVTKTNFVNIGGSPAPFDEDFEMDEIPGKSWTLLNPNNDITWDIAYTNGNPPGNRSARMMIYGTNTMGRRDWLISPALDLSGLQTASLSFRHAYAQYQPEYSDTLIVLSSDDCGLTWTQIIKLYDDGSGTFATHIPTDQSFVPLVADDWCGGSYGSSCNILQVNDLAGKKNVKIAFESVSFTTNNIYLDDVSVAASSGLEQMLDPGESMLIFPNPSTGIFYFVTDENLEPDWLKIFTPQGQVVLEMDISNMIPNIPLKISLSHLPKSLYYCEIKTGNGKFVKKLLTQ